MTPGHNKVPNETCYQSFSSEVKKFLQANRHNGISLSNSKHSLKLFRTKPFSMFLFRQDKLIGVHCTHGLNRTGYLIVR